MKQKLLQLTQEEIDSHSSRLLPPTRMVTLHSDVPAGCITSGNQARGKSEATESFHDGLGIRLPGSALNRMGLQKMAAACRMQGRCEASARQGRQPNAAGDFRKSIRRDATRRADSQRRS